MAVNNIVASEKQLSLLSIKYIKHHLIVLHGAIRSGKTLFGSYAFAEFIEHVAVEVPLPGQNRFAFVGHASVEHTYDNVTINAITWLKARGWSFTKKGKSAYTARKGRRTISIEQYAMSNSTSYKSLQGGTFRGLFLDEAPLYNQNAIEMAISRCVAFDDYKVFMTGNPEGTELHFFYATYISPKSEAVKNGDILVKHFALTDNPVNDESKLKYYKTLFTETMFKRKVLGLWVQVQGAVFKKFNAEQHVKDREYNADEYTMGIDYGEADATSAVLRGWWGVRETHAFKQYYHMNSNDEKDINDYLDDIEAFIHECYALTGKCIDVYVDSANLTFYKQLKKREDYRCIIRKTNKGKRDPKSQSAIQERIDHTNIALGGNALTISPSCEHLISEIANAVYDDNGKRRDDKTHRVDSIDSFEYGGLDNMKMLVEWLLK